MRFRGLGLAAVFVLLVACAEKTTSPASAPVPPAVVVQPSAPERQPSSPPAPARPSTSPVVVTPSPAAPSPTPPAQPPSSERAGSILYIAVQRANFRQTPDLKARILAVLTKGTKLTVIEKSAQWYRVRLDDGKEGWVAESVTSTKPD